MKRTIANCSLIKKSVSAGIGCPFVIKGQCAGYQKNDDDDEPCEICKKCKLFIGWKLKGGAE